jgi:hypothetical protein
MGAGSRDAVENWRGLRVGKVIFDHEATRSAPELHARHEATRPLLFAFAGDAWFMITVQALDGITGAIVFRCDRRPTAIRIALEKSLSSAARGASTSRKV